MMCLLRCGSSEREEAEEGEVSDGQAGARCSFGKRVGN